MRNKNDHSISKRQGIWAAFLLALAFMMAQPAKAQTQWVTNGNNINNTNSGNVGIGTTIPLATLHVATTSTAVSMSRGMVLSLHTDDSNSPLFTLAKSRGTIASPTSVMNGDNLGSLFSAGYDGSSYVLGSRIRFAVDGAVTTGNIPTSIQFLTGINGSVERMRITSAGNVGIGTTTPNTKLHVLMTPTTNAITKQTDLNDFLLLSGWGDLNARTGFVGSFATSPGVSSGVILGREGLLWGTYVAFHTHGDHANALDELAERMRISANGNVGIGTATPGYRLDVQGGLINSSGGLCIAGDCKTAWSQVGGGGSSQWTTSGTNIYYNAGNVGIGTTAPTAKLQVAGDVVLTSTGNLSATGTITAGNIVAKYQDIAEWVPSRQAIPAGTVVVLDADQLHHVLASSQAYDTSVAGVVSDKPGLILGEGGNGKVLVATTGRVRVKVDATRAPIRVGDILVTSDKEGIAMKSEPIDLGGAKIHRPGTIIGKALEPLDKGTGEILVLLSLQ